MVTGYSGEIVCFSLEFFPDLVKLLKQHPKGKHRDLKSHPVTRAVFQGLDDLGIDQCRLDDWCIDVVKGFMQRNSEALPTPVLTDNGCDGLDEIQVDARSFLTQMNTLTRAHVGVNNRMGSTEESVCLIIDPQDRLEGKMDGVIEDLKLEITNDTRFLWSAEQEEQILRTCQEWIPLELGGSHQAGLKSLWSLS